MTQAIIGIACDIKMIGLQPFHAAGDKYVAAAVGGSGGLPVLIPALGDPVLLQGLLDHLDGVILPGSHSNIQPHHYGTETSRHGTIHDPARDATTLPLVSMLLQSGIPLLGICRGFQEINVALGGALFQHVHEQPGFLDHREPDDDDLDVQYAPAHRVHFPEDGLLRQWLGQTSAKVNSLHGQGIKHLADGLVPEAVADDGLIEAFSVRGATRFAFAVQWHPEWKYADSPLSRAIFQAFAEACRARKEMR